MLNNLNQVENQDYSKNIFVGKVVYNEDPLRLRRVKVSIPSMFEEDSHTNLPWIAPMFMGLVANGSGSGSAHLAPAVGTELIVEFQMGSPLHGLYIASPMRPDQLPAELVDADWQWTYGWKDPAGNIFLVNTKSGSNQIRMFHASGTEIKIDNAGKINVKGVNDLEVVIEGDVHLTTQGNLTSDTAGNVTHNVGGDFRVSAARIYLNE